MKKEDIRAQNALAGESGSDILLFVKQVFFHLCC